MNTTLVPGWAASNCLPSVVNASCSDAAAKTLTVPDRVGELDATAGAEEGATVMLVVPQPASTSPVATAVRLTTVRRICCSKSRECWG